MQTLPRLYGNAFFLQKEAKQECSHHTYYRCLQTQFEATIDIDTATAAAAAAATSADTACRGNICISNTT